MRRTTIFLPEALHERLRKEAFRSRVSMAELIRTKLGHRPRNFKRAPWKPEDDPLLKVAGIAKGYATSKDIDKHLYGE